METTLKVISFTALDRCDRCGAQALARAEKAGRDLLFCNHHLRKNYDVLLDGGWEIVEDYEAIQNLGATPMGAY